MLGMPIGVEKYIQIPHCYQVQYTARHQRSRIGMQKQKIEIQSGLKQDARPASEGKLE